MAIISHDRLWRTAPPVTNVLTFVRSNWILGLLLYATVTLAPLPFGSTDPPTIAFWCVILGIALMTPSLRGLRVVHLAMLIGVAVIILAYALVLHEQLSTHQWFAAAHPLWHDASQILGIPLQPSVSVARNQPFFALGASLAAIMSLVCGVIVGADRERARQLLRVVAWSGAGYAAFAIISFLIDPAMLLWRTKEAHNTVLTGTFTNRNTAAVYFGSCAIVWLLLICEAIRHRLSQRGASWRSVLNYLLIETRVRSFTSFLMLFLCLAAMFMTASRAGVVLSLISLVIAFTGFFYRDLPRRGGAILLLAVGGATALILLQLMGGGVNGRFDTIGFGDDSRLEVYRSTMRMIADHPWFGTGLGTFNWSFPEYRSANISMFGVYDRAHDTLLELTADMGLPLAALVALAWVFALAALFRGIKIRRRDHIIPTAGLSVAILALTQSFVEFSLQTPGCAIIVFALVGAGLSQSFSNRSGRPIGSRDQRRDEQRVAI
jgi:hypothetical protein